MANEKILVDVIRIREQITEWYNHGSGLERSVLKDVLDLLDKEVQAVTRCKDCDNTCQGNHGLVCTIWGAGTDPNGWCYKEERRDNNATE